MTTLSQAVNEAARSEEEYPLVIIGGGPAGLAAAEAALEAGVKAIVIEAKPSLARKFLMAGKSGLNITKAEPRELFLSRYGKAEKWLTPAIDAFHPDAIMDWADEMGANCFIGSSGRVFPEIMKASPLLRAWIHKLDAGGVRFRTGWRWVGFGGNPHELCFQTADGAKTIKAQKIILALGGASWQRLGSDAAWVPWLEEIGVHIAPFKPANMGFLVDWSTYFSGKFAGQPVKGCTLQAAGHGDSRRAEFVISTDGIEGGGVYALSAPLRDDLEKGNAALRIDLLPTRSTTEVHEALAAPRGKNSFANHLRKKLKLDPVKLALLRECTSKECFQDIDQLAIALKALDIPLTAPRPIDEAISVAGGIPENAFNKDFSLRKFPHIYCAGEMLDWEAPTGGYLLTACMATGRAAGTAAAQH